MSPEETDLDFLARFGTKTCPSCGLDGLPVSLRDDEDGRYIGWSCPKCNLGGVIGTHHPATPTTESA